MMKITFQQHIAAGVIPVIKKGRGACYCLKLNVIEHFGMAFVEDRLIGMLSRSMAIIKHPNEAKLTQEIEVLVVDKSNTR